MDSEIKKPLSLRKPFRILSLMEKEEIHQFEVFMNGAMSSGSAERQLTTFFAHCRQQEVWSHEIDRTIFLSKSGLKLANNTFDKLVSRLYQYLINYIGMQGLLQRPAQVYPFAVNYLSSRSLSPKEIDKKVAESHRAIEKFPPNAEYFRASLDLQLVLANASQSRTEKPGSRGLHHLHDDLDAYYFIQKLRFLCASINEQHVFQSSWEQKNEAELMPWLDAAYPSMPSLAKTYYHAYYVLRGVNSPIHFGEFRRLLAEWEEEFGHSYEITDLHIYLLNFFFIRYNNGELACLPNIDQLFIDLLAQGSILDQGRMLPEYFKNIINVKCRLGKTDEARDIFDTYVNRLTDQQEGAALTYNDISIRFYEHRFDEVRDSIEALLESPEATKTDMSYGLNLRCLLLKTYYCLLGTLDLSRWDATDDRFRSLLRSFRTYIERKQVSRMSRVRFENFRKALKRLYLLNYATSDATKFVGEREALLKNINSSSNLPDKAWFIAQLNSPV